MITENQSATGRNQQDHFASNRFRMPPNPQKKTVKLDGLVMSTNLQRNMTA